MKKLLLPPLILAMMFSFQPKIKAQYYVERGDTFYSIAKSHNMSLKDLISLNPQHVNPNKIHVGDYIIIREKGEMQKTLTDYAKSLTEVTAYKYGANNFPYETDCSGWVQGIYKKFGVALPRVSKDQATTGIPVKFSDLQIGDLMFFSTRADKVITHVGIYLGPESQMWISNLNADKDVEVLPIWGSWSQKYFMWGTRYKL